MSKSKGETKSRKRNINDVVLITSSAPSIPGIELHSKSQASSVVKPLEDLKEEWNVINQQVMILLNETENTSTGTGFKLDEVTFSLSINAKGKIGFIVGGEVGGEASITLTFKRK